MNQHAGLRKKALFSHLMTAIASIVILVIAVYFFCYREMRSYAIELTQRQVTAIVSIEHRDHWRDDPGFGNVIELFQRLIGGKILLVDSIDGRVVFSEILADPLTQDDSSLNPELRRIRTAAVEDSALIELGERALQAELLGGIGRFEHFNGRMVYASAAVLSPDGHTRYAVLALRPASRLMDMSNRLILTMFIAFLLGVLVAILLSMLYVSRLMRPIQMETAAAERLAEGDYTARVKVDSGDEIGRLGETLNQLAARVDSSMKALRGERDQLNAIIANIDEGLLAVDHSLQPAYFNQAFLEYSELSNADHVVEAIHRQAKYPAFFQALRRAMAEGTTERLQWRSDGGRSILTIITPVNDASSDVAAICLLMDVSDTERLEQLRRDYVANVSHELRTPLTGIRGMLEPIMDGVIESEEEKQRYYRAIHHEALRMEKMVSEILEISRLQDASFSIPLQSVDLYAALDQAVHNIRPKAQKTNVALALGEDLRGQVVWGNLDRLYQVIVILLDNAVKFTPQGGSVTVNARAREHMIDISVSDTGCGIEPKDLKLIWERFFKADRSRSKMNGTGLGLPIAKLLVEKMGGEIRVESRVQVGTAFTVSLRASAPDATGDTLKNT